MLFRFTLVVLSILLVSPLNAQPDRRSDPGPKLRPSTSLTIQKLSGSKSAASRPAMQRPTTVAPARTAAADAPTQGRVSAADQIRVLLVAELETTLSSPATGRIIKLNATTGAGFGPGQVLIGFECDEPSARLSMAQAELAGAQETLEARVRMQGLEQASDVEVVLAAAAVAKARGQIELHKAQISQCTIRAPWAGRVAKVHARNFMSVTPGQPLLDVVKSGPLRLKLNLPSKLIARMTPGKRITISIDETGKTYEARVRAVNSRVDPVSQTVEVEAAITRSWPELLPGMSGVVDLASLE